MTQRTYSTAKRISRNVAALKLKAVIELLLQYELVEFIINFGYAIYFHMNEFWFGSIGTFSKAHGLACFGIT